MKRTKKRDMSIQIKLLLVNILGISLIAMLVLYNNFHLEGMINDIDSIYEGNVDLINMSNCLEQIHGSMTEYLTTKSTESMKKYYEQKENYEKMLDGLNSEISDNPIRNKERNILMMSQHYLELTELSITYKRGRKTSSYAEIYGESSSLYRYILVGFQDLNNELFENNTKTYLAFIGQLKQVESSAIMELLFILVLVIFILMVINRMITKPLTMLAKQANDIAKGNFKVEKLKIESLDEVGIVNKAFNEMLESINSYIEWMKDSMKKEKIHMENELKMENYLKDAKLKYLQAQIHPHFLFNTLNAGAQLAMIEEADQTYEYLLKTAQFFRYNIGKGNDVVTLKDEMELVDLYMYILNVRFSNEIQYHTEIEDEALTEIQLPRMILQPIIENSVKYGIPEMKGKGVITVRVYREQERVIVQILDNGKGITKERQEEIRSGGASVTEGDSNGVGLANVIGRLNLYYNRTDVFFIESEGENRGTVVTLRLENVEE